MVTIHAKTAQSILERTKGLLGAKKPYPLFFKTRWGIHTFGMKFPIDVVILDKENKVVAIKKNLIPYRMFFWNPRYDRVLELPKEDSKRIHNGDTVAIIEISTDERT